MLVEEHIMDQEMSEPWLVCKVHSKVLCSYLVTVNHQSDDLHRYHLVTSGVHKMPVLRILENYIYFS